MSLCPKKACGIASLHTVRFQKQVIERNLVNELSKASAKSLRHSFYNRIAWLLRLYQVAMRRKRAAFVLADRVRNACAFFAFGVGQIRWLRMLADHYHDAAIRSCSNLPVRSMQSNLIKTPTLM